jgi:D-alanyl-D-alanine carboxypeptidase (penicillin-binding protein 5/6)
MTKMMTIMLALEELKRRPDINLDTPVKVSPAASKVGGSQVYLDPKETFPLRELLKTVAIKSANDSSYQVAEFLGNGDVNAFVKKMNSTAAQMGLNQTRFYNPHGLPGKNSREDNRSCPEDLVFIAETLLEYPTAMKWASTWTDSFRPKGQKGWQLLTNHNRLVNGSCPGVDGLKTGYIKRSGYCITVTCKRNGKRMVAVLTGFPPGHRRDRDKFAKQLLDWGYEKAYEDKQTVKKKNSGKQVL